MNNVAFYFTDSKIHIKSKKKLKIFITNLFFNEKFVLDKISFIFCSDAYLLNLNRKFLKHDYLTDILTFLNSEATEPIEADVFISVDRIKENAKFYHAQYQNELLRVMIHGVLHLCGYNDKQEHEKVEMRKKEDFYIKSFGLHST